MLKFARSFILAASLAVALAMPSQALDMSFGRSKAPESFADLAEQLSDAVVNISTTATVQNDAKQIPMPQFPEGSPFQEFFQEFMERNLRPDSTPRKTSSLGSGFVIDASGLVITNNHVIDGADEITVSFNNGTKLKAKLLGKDPKTDIALLKVTPEKPLKAVSLGDSDKMRVGDWVVAIGNPFGLGGTVTAGIISARNRDINAGPYDNFIQTDAAINRGNSGGPLFNMAGEVIGINTAILSPSGGSIGLGFAIPAATAQRVIAQLKDFGETRRGWLGVRIQPVTPDIAEGLQLGKPRGALVAGVTATGPSDKAGIKKGDVIVEFDGKPISEAKDLPRLVADTAVDKEADVKIIRQGKEQVLKIKLGRLEEGEKLEGKQSKAGATESDATKLDLGLSVAPLSDVLRKQYRLSPTLQGVVITAVDANSQAAERQIRAGDVVVEVNQEVVKSPEDVVARLDAAKKAGLKSVLFLLTSREGEPRFVPLTLK